MVFFTKKVVIYYMSLKNYFRSIAQDMKLYENLFKPLHDSRLLQI
jgi:hypothetical protein